MQDVRADAEFQQLVLSPKLPLYVKQLESVLQRECQNRERFYEEISEQDKVEFINGQVVLQSPVKLQHDAASGALYSLMSAFVSVHGRGYVGHEKLMVSLTRNDYEPDICFFRTEKADTFLSEQTRFPAPDLVVEVISDSTEAVDRGIKFEDYAAHEVAEYWLVDPIHETVEQYVLREEAFELLVKSNSGVVRGRTLTDFEIPVKAIFNTEENLRVLREIMRTPPG